MAQVITVAQQKGGAGKTTIAVNLAVALARAGHRVAALDTDPQGSMGRWFMARADAGEPGLDFSTASAWGVGFEVKKLKRDNAFIVIDTPPKVDSDLRPALRESDLVVIPVATSQVDLWALDSILELTDRVGVPGMVVLNRYKSGTRVSHEIEGAIEARAVRRAETVVGDRVVYAETLGQGQGVVEHGRGAARDEMQALMAETLSALA